MKIVGCLPKRVQPKFPSRRIKVLKRNLTCARSALDRPGRRRPVRHPRKGQPMRNYRIGVVMVVTALASLSFSGEMARRESPITKFMRQRLHGERDRLL